VDIIKEIESFKTVGRTKISTKLEKAYKHFNLVRTSFPSTDTLKDKERKLLHILETRSELNNGDTKVNNETLGKLLNPDHPVSRQTITRYLKKLEDLGYIARLTVPYKKFKDFVCDRTIRCRRILLKHRFKWKEKTKWKKDFRPPFILSNSVDESTGKIINVNWTMDAKTKMRSAGKIIFRAAWDSFQDLFNAGLLDPDQQDFYCKWKDIKETDDTNIMASLLLGKGYQS